MNLLDELSNEDKKCTGCGACYNICPVNAIQMNPDFQGFLYPSVDVEKCINCLKCKNICPKIKSDFSNSERPDCYAAWGSDDIRLKSSSGGIFTLLSEYILNQGGVVAGVAMDNKYNVYHKIIDNNKSLDEIRKSKYVQSDTRKIYSNVLKYLEDGKKVLFSGCPCQVSAMRNIAGDNKNLYLIDIICHGVPSNRMWKDYISENFDVNKLVNIEFRSKLNGWRAEQLRAFYSDGTSECIPWPESAYEEGFQRNICLRNGCENCEFAGYNRQGDITLGDFWRIEDYKNDLNDGKGTSAILVNNKKGEKLLNEIKNKIVNIEKVDIDIAAKWNRLHHKFESHINKERFNTLYPLNHNFTESIMQCRHNLYDIGLVGIYCVKNFGGQLTQYALYKKLTQMGYSVLMIECPKNSINPPSPRGPYLFEQQPYPAYSMSRVYPNIAEMKFLNKQCNTFVTGSDQMFNNNLYNNHNKFMSLNFVTDNHKKIAYAASWGHDKIWGEEDDRAEEAYFLNKFDYFSVREKSAIKLARDKFGLENVTWVLDPVFLCPLEDYKRMENIGRKSLPDKKFLFAYILDPNKEKENILNAYAQKNEWYVRAVQDEDPQNRIKDINDFWNIDTIQHTTIEVWISHIANSEFVITDSFHGTCLAILFHKEFIVLVNKLRGETRFKSLLNLLDLEDRMCYSIKQAEEKMYNLMPINYDRIDIVLNKERVKSISWLINSIESECSVKHFSEFDILDKRIDRIRNMYDNQITELKNELYHVNEALKIVKKQYINLLNDDFLKMCMTDFIEDYLSILFVVRKKCIIFISVKDTPGLAVNDNIAVRLMKLGCEDFRNRHWCGYTGIINSGNIIINDMKNINEISEHRINIDNLKVFISSKPYQKGNTAIIELNGENYAVNKRGINIVVWSKEDNKIVDSVAFDTHVQGFTCYRF